VLPYQRNWSRDADALDDSLGRLDRLWEQVRDSGPAPTPQDAVRAREAAAMLATSRWMYRSALQRTETRGMSRRSDHPGVDPLQQYRLLSGGLDEVWTTTDRVDNPASSLTRHTEAVPA